MLTCGSPSPTSIESCNADEFACWVLSNVSVKVYEPAQNTSVSKLNVNTPLLLGVGNVLAPLCAVGTPFSNIVVGPDAVQLGRTGPLATSVFAVLLVTGLVWTACAQAAGGVVYQSSVSVHVMGATLPCTALAGTEKLLIV